MAPLKECDFWFGSVGAFSFPFHCGAASAKFRKAAPRNFASLRRCGKAHSGSPVHGLRRSRECYMEDYYIK
jgi:hypothetical protein